jgi:hypothetical protein
MSISHVHRDSSFDPTTVNERPTERHAGSRQLLVERVWSEWIGLDICLFPIRPITGGNQDGNKPKPQAVPDGQ